MAGYKIEKYSRNSGPAVLISALCPLPSAQFTINNLKNETQLYNNDILPDNNSRL
ncbi:hypothetical protein SAMN05660816_03708 [Niastella yeongjuensis]|nr:hypothetical protein SAMN05660816_03708 [Niastella yeongjuensis]